MADASAWLASPDPSTGTQSRRSTGGGRHRLDAGYAPGPPASAFLRQLCHAGCAGSGGLGLLSGIDVTSNATAALGNIESLIQTAIGAAAEFGSVEKRIEIQSSFVSGLSDAMKVGIGSMVDADMEETSARLQALQVQQQLGIQSLSIANQAPQNVLSLFR